METRSRVRSGRSLYWNLNEEISGQLADVRAPRMQEETLDMKQGEMSMISREDNEINEKETM